MGIFNTRTFKLERFPRVEHTWRFSGAKIALVKDLRDDFGLCHIAKRARMQPRFQGFSSYLRDPGNEVGKDGENRRESGINDIDV